MKRALPVILLPLFLVSCGKNDTHDTAALTDEISALTERVAELETANEAVQAELKEINIDVVDNFETMKVLDQNTHELVKTTGEALDSYRFAIKELQGKLDAEIAKRSSSEQFDAQLAASSEARDRQARAEAAAQEREAAEQERRRLAQLEPQAAPIKAKIRELENSRVALNKRIEAVMNFKVERHVGDTIGQSEKWLKEDLAKKQAMLDQLNSEANLIDNAIANQQDNLERLYRGR